MEKKLNQPQFICIGAQKAGTTWLYEALSQNPTIWLPPLKEIHYFDNLEPSADTLAKRISKINKLIEKTRYHESFARRLMHSLGRSSRQRRSSLKNEYLFLKSLLKDDILTEDWYRRIFSSRDALNKISGEITPSYLALQESEISYVKSLIGNGKIIVILREPVARAISQLRMNVTRSSKKPRTEADWTAAVNRIFSLDRGSYGESIPRWQKFFGPDQLLILPFGDIKKRPADFIRQIEDFIGAEPHLNYGALQQAVHMTKNVEIPDWIISRMKADLGRHQDYLIETFGEEFYQRTR